MIEVDCEHCGEIFDVADNLAGGLTNCPRCGKATSVEGLRDPMFRLVQIVLVGVWVVICSTAWVYIGPLAALILGGVTALLFGLIYICL